MDVVLISKDYNAGSQTEIAIPLSVETPQVVPRECVSYVENDRIGAGYFANVYKGTLKTAEGETWDVAIKVLNRCDMRSSTTEEARNERLRKRATRESGTWAALSHPNILPMLGVCYGENPLIITPYCKSGNLHAFMKSQPTITASQRLGFLLGAARGLEHLHTFIPPIRHGDVKPNNILVGDNETDVFLCDFGLAEGFEAIDKANATSGLHSGTVRFASPEQLHEAKTTVPGDVFSFGCVILNLMTGLLPWHCTPKDSAVNGLRLSQRGATPDLSSYPSLTRDDSLVELMTKCWSYDSFSRPKMTEVIQALEGKLKQISME